MEPVLFVILGFILIIAVIILIITIPIKIAKHRGVTGSELTTITILSWLSLLIGITWFIALILSLIYQPKKWVDKDDSTKTDDLDKLEKLFSLKEKGVISQEEYEEAKSKIIIK